jgi:hypothetical protein
MPLNWFKIKISGISLSNLILNQATYEMVCHFSTEKSLNALNTVKHLVTSTLNYLLHFYNEYLFRNKVIISV